MHVDTNQLFMKCDGDKYKTKTQVLKDKMIAEANRAAQKARIKNRLKSSLVTRYGSLDEGDLDKIIEQEVNYDDLNFEKWSKSSFKKFREESEKRLKERIGNSVFQSILLGHRTKYRLENHLFKAIKPEIYSNMRDQLTLGFGSRLSKL